MINRKHTTATVLMCGQLRDMEMRCRHLQECTSEEVQQLECADELRCRLGDMIPKLRRLLDQLTSEVYAPPAQS